jgi:hypothetical protein
VGQQPNPYEQAFSIIARTLAPFDDDNLIPSYGFGDGERILQHIKLCVPAVLGNHKVGKFSACYCIFLLSGGGEKSLYGLSCGIMAP